MEHKSPVELLAPAGNVKAFLGAVHAGADAIYLGGNKYGARAYADNFTDEELIWCIKYAHLYGRRVYLTVNTLVKESEFDGIYAFLSPLYEAGLDGAIVQDTGVLAYIRDTFPGLELHASTQMTITSVYGARLAKKLGVCRVVPARELSLSEIKFIHEDTGLEIESFIHGAMCYCYSGQCLFSSILGGRSGNRGRCAQPCRLPYDVSFKDKKTDKCYPLSLKDMCTIEYLPDLIEAGIYSFKIEGRMKKPEYAAGVTAIYRKYIDMYLAQREAYVSGKKKWQPDKNDLEALSKLYIRSEIQNGYYYRHNGKNMVTFSSPSYSGSDDELMDSIRGRYIDTMPKYRVKINTMLIKDMPARVVFVCQDNTTEAFGLKEEISVLAEGDIVQTAVSQPITPDNIKKQLIKLGDTPFIVDDIEIKCDADIFYPVGKLNELRRIAVAMLEDKIIDTRNMVSSRETVDSHPASHAFCKTAVYSSNEDNDEKEIRIRVRTMEQLKAAEQFDFYDLIYIDADLLVYNTDETIDTVKKLYQYKRKIFFALPYIIRKRDAEFLDTLYKLLKEYIHLFAGIMVCSLDSLEFVLEGAFEKDICSDAGFYIWNKSAVSLWENYISSFCMPYELNFTEQKSLLNLMPCEKVIYGMIPMMQTANCVVNTCFGCVGRGVSTAVLTDRYGKKFPVEINCRHCMNIIYNSVPLSLHGDLNKLKKVMNLRLDFTVEDRHTVEIVLKFFEAVFSEGTKQAPPYSDYTTGHEKRGVE